MHGRHFTQSLKEAKVKTHRGRDMVFGPPRAFFGIVGLCNRHKSGDLARESGELGAQMSGRDNATVAVEQSFPGPADS